MSFLTVIKNRARDLARDGLEKAGFTIHNLPDDVDDSKDILDIYRELSAPADQVDPIDPVDREQLKNRIVPFCGHNTEILSSVEAWLEHREEIIEFQPEIKAATPEQLWHEAMDLLLHAGLVQHAGNDGLSAIQTVSRAQNRHVSNLLRIASYQCLSDSLDDWIDRMNEKIERFGLVIVNLGDDLLSMTDVEG